MTKLRNWYSNLSFQQKFALHALVTWPITFFLLFLAIMWILAGLNPVWYAEVMMPAMRVGQPVNMMFTILCFGPWLIVLNPVGITVMLGYAAYRLVKATVTAKPPAPDFTAELPDGTVVHGDFKTGPYPTGKAQVEAYRDLGERIREYRGFKAHEIPERTIPDDYDEQEIREAYRVATLEARRILFDGFWCDEHNQPWDEEGCPVCREEQEQEVEPIIGLISETRKYFNRRNQ